MTLEFYVLNLVSYDRYELHHLSFHTPYDRFQDGNLHPYTYGPCLLAREVLGLREGQLEPQVSCFKLQ